MELLQARARLDPQLVDERAATPAGTHRAPPPAGPSGRAQASTAPGSRSRSGCSADERLELADEVPRLAGLELGVDALLDSVSRSSSSRAISLCAKAS